MNTIAQPVVATPSTRPLCLVTGAASGLGYTLARAFAEAGCDLVLADGDDVDLTLAAEELAFAGVAVEVHCVGVDLTTLSGAATLHRKLRSLDRPIDIFVANASLGAWGDFGTRLSLDDELAMAQVNTISLLQLVRLVGADMTRRGHGQILLASSRAAAACAFAPVQEAARAFAMSLAEGIAEAFARDGVMVSSLSPDIEAEGASACLRDPASVLAIARATTERARTRRPAAPRASPAPRPLPGPTALGRIHFFFGGSAEMPSA